MTGSDSLRFVKGDKTTHIVDSDWPETTMCGKSAVPKPKPQQPICKVCEAATCLRVPKVTAHDKR